MGGWSSPLEGEWGTVVMTVPSMGVMEHPSVAAKTKPKAKYSGVTLSPVGFERTLRGVQGD